MIRYIFSLILFLLCSIVFGQEKTIVFNFENASFNELVNTVKKQTGVNIFFDKKLTSKINVNLNVDSISIEELLKQVLKETNLTISKWHDSFVILDNEKLIQKLPDFIQNVYLIKRLNKQEITKNEKKYISGRKPNIIQIINVGNKNIQSDGIVKILGKILDNDTGEPIIGATIYIENIQIGTATDLNGYFNISLPCGNYNARISSLGYETKLYKLQVYSEASIRIELESTTFSLQEAVIKGDKQLDVKFKDPGLEKLTIKSIKAIPMMMGEKDILKISEMLPGIVSVGEGSSGINVRGGGNDQNAIYINKIPIYNTSHLFGFFPAFNSDIIKDFTIYKGYIPTEYGGRLSSVFNITTKQGNRKKYSLHGGINPISAHVTLEGPIKKDKSSILLSVRKSYSDWILSRLNDPTIRKSNVNFNDISFGLSNDFGKSLLSLFVYSSDDNVDLANVSSYNYSNRGASLSLLNIFNNLLSMNTSIVGSQYSFKTIDKQEISTAYQYNYQINHYEFKNDFTKVIGTNNEINFGVNGIYYKLDRGDVVPYGGESLKNPVHHGNEQGIELALYLADTYDITSWLTINAGFRYSIFTSLGNKKVYTYYDNKARDISNIEDTLLYENNEVIKWYKSPEFRMALNFQTDPNGTIKMAFNQMSQNLFMLNNTISVAPNSQWKLADYHLKPARSNQLSFGVFRNFPKNNIEASMELFYKKTKDFTEFKDGANFINSPQVETELLQGNQNSYGIELMIKRNRGNINGWLAYTYSRSFVQINSANDWEQINNGKVYPSNYDIPHVVNAVLNYDISKRVTLSSVITYQNGKPITYPVSIYYLDNMPLVDYSDRNKYRIPDYFRTDLSLTLEGNLKKDKLIHSLWTFSVYNVTGRNNAYTVYFISDNGYIKGYKYSVIGEPFFTITWLFKLGNYATQ